MRRIHHASLIGLLASTSFASVTLHATDAQSWSTTPCGADPARRLAFQDDIIWKLWARDTVPPGSAARLELSRAVDAWNAIDGAQDLLDITQESFTQCTSGYDGGAVAIGLDDGTCMAWSGNAWGPAQTGTTLFWHDNCRITQVFTYVNSRVGFRGEALRNTLIHELGHVLYYAHNWHELSIMGYAYAGTPPMVELSARDHAYLRAVFPEPHTPQPDIRLQTFVQLDALGDRVRPEVASYGHARNPTCGNIACGTLSTGDELEALVTLENVGAAASQQVELRLMLAEVELGAWSITSLPAEYFTAQALTGTFEGHLPGGSHPLTLRAFHQGVEADRLDLGNLAVVCTPQCATGACGDDRCGGSCAPCQQGLTCMERACIPTPALDMDAPTDLDNLPDSLMIDMKLDDRDATPDLVDEGDVASDMPSNLPPDAIADDGTLIIIIPPRAGGDSEEGGCTTAPHGNTAPQRAPWLALLAALLAATLRSSLPRCARGV